MNASDRGMNVLPGPVGVLDDADPEVLRGVYREIRTSASRRRRVLSRDAGDRSLRLTGRCADSPASAARPADRRAGRRFHANS